VFKRAGACAGTGGGVTGFEGCVLDGIGSDDREETDRFGKKETVFAEALYARAVAGGYFCFFCLMRLRREFWIVICLGFR
jgi:hypothetical protein